MSIITLPGESHGQRSLVGYSPWVAESQTQLKWLHTHLFALQCWVVSSVQKSKLIIHIHIPLFLSFPPTLLNVLWQPGWERGWGENGSVYIYDWVPSLFTWNYHNSVNWLCAKLFQLCPTPCSSMDCSLQVPLSMQFSRQEYWSGLPCHPPGDRPNPGIEHLSLTSPALAGGCSTTSAANTKLKVQKEK